MAQRYTELQSRSWMEAGACPECGKPAEAHSNSIHIFRALSSACSLLPIGVTMRIEQYEADKETER